MRLQLVGTFLTHRPNRKLSIDCKQKMFDQTKKLTTGIVSEQMKCFVFNLMIVYLFIV